MRHGAGFDGRRRELAFHEVISCAHLVSGCGTVRSRSWRAIHQAASDFRGRPRPLLAATILPSTRISPPQTPQGSSRSSAPSRHATASGHCWHSALAAAICGACSANQSSGSWFRQGTRLSTSELNSAPSERVSGFACGFVVTAIAVDECSSTVWIVAAMRILCFIP